MSNAQTTDQFLILGCHFTRNEMPFIYNTTLNKYEYKPELDPTKNSSNFEQDGAQAEPTGEHGLNLDLYRSNDYV